MHAAITKKRILLILLVIFSAKCFCGDTETITISDFNQKILGLPYTKSEGVTVLYRSDQVSVVIEEIIIDGSEKYTGEIFDYGVGDVANEPRLKEAEPGKILLEEEMRWSVKNENEPGNRYLFFSSLVERHPIYYKIPENTKSIKIRYHIRYPNRTSSDSYEKTFNLEWKPPEKDYSLVLEVDLYMYKNGEYIGQKVLGESNISITDNTDDLLYFLDNIYKNLTEEERIEVLESYNEMVTVMEKKTLFRLGDRFRFNNGISGKSFFTVWILR